MKINAFSNLTLRALIYMALKENTSVTTQEISQAYRVSFNHMKKVMQNLADNGYVKGTKGRHGGYLLSHSPKNINIGQVFRKTIENIAIVECFASLDSTCVIAPDCRLRHILIDATETFINVLSGYTLSDLVEGRRSTLSSRLGIEITELS